MDDALRETSDQSALPDSLRRVFGFSRDEADWFGDLAARLRPQTLGRLGSFDLIAEAGRGGQGVVYRARQRRPARDVALKRLATGVFASPSTKARFEREIEAVTALDHPHIVQVYGVEEIDDQLVVAMRWIDGIPIDRWVENLLQSGDSGRPDYPNSSTQRLILNTFLGVCDAIQHAHQRGVIHRDLKPSNILVDKSGCPQVLDFGLAKRTRESHDSPDDPAAAAALTLEGQFLGTLAWGSPEQATGDPRRIDTRTDIYSLGLLLYYVLTGQMPYSTQGDWRAVLERIQTADPLPPRRAMQGPRGRVLKINIDLEAITLRCLAKEPDRRYQTAGELAEDIRRLQAGDAVSARRDSNWYLLRKSIRRNRVPLAIAACVAALGVTAIWAVRQQRTANVAASKAVVATWLKQMQVLRNDVPRAAPDETSQAALIGLWQRVESGEAGAQELQDLAAATVRFEFATRSIVAREAFSVRDFVPTLTRVGWIPPGYALQIQPTLTLDGRTAETPATDYAYVTSCVDESIVFVRGISLGSHVVGGSLSIEFLKLRSPIPPGVIHLLERGDFAPGRDPLRLGTQPTMLPVHSQDFVVTEFPVPNYPLEVSIPEFERQFAAEFSVLSAAWVYASRFGDPFGPRNLIRVRVECPAPPMDVALQVRLRIPGYDVSVTHDLATRVSRARGAPQLIPGPTRRDREIVQTNDRWQISLDMVAGTVTPLVYPDQLIGESLEVQFSSSAAVAGADSAIEKYLRLSADGAVMISEARTDLQRRASEVADRHLFEEALPADALARLVARTDVPSDVADLAASMINAQNDPVTLQSQGWLVALSSRQTPERYQWALRRLAHAREKLDAAHEPPFKLALGYYRVGEFRGALGLPGWEGAALRRNAAANAIRGMCHARLGEYAEAVEALNEADAHLRSHPSEDPQLASLLDEARKVIAHQAQH